METDQHISVHELRQSLIDEIIKSVGLPRTPFWRKIFSPIFWLPTDRFSRFGSKFDALVAKSGFNKAVRKMGVDHTCGYGKGAAVLMNLSPVWYNAYRVNGIEPAAKRKMFMKHVAAAGVKPWVRIAGAGEKTFGYEITYWNKGDRTLLYVITNAERRANMLGGGNSVA